MRIAYITQSYPPMVSGAAIFAESLANEMSKRGYEVLVVAASDKDHAYTTQTGNLTIARLASIHNPIRVGQRFLLFPRREFLRVLNSFQPNLIHSHDALTLGYMGLGYARHTHIPAALTIHQLPWFIASYLPDKFGFRKFTEDALWMYARWALPQFSSLITPTQTISTVIKNRINIQPHTISYGMDLEAFHLQLDRSTGLVIRAKLSLPADAPIILHVGRLDADKRVDRVVSASANILREMNAYLVVVGDGCQKSALMKMCQSLGIADRVRFTGYISMREGLPEIYRMADVFVTASEIETQGIVLLEAAASGLPIAAVRATCIPEIVHDGVNGYLAKSGGVLSLENVLRNLLSDPARSKEMGWSGRILVESHAAQHTIGQHMQLYQELAVKKIESPVKVMSVRYRKFIRGWLKL